MNSNINFTHNLIFCTQTASAVSAASAASAACVRHLEVFNKLNPDQHVFRSRQSCLSQLLEHHDQILSHLEDGLNVDSIYLDFSKALDKVDIGILCHQMRKLGIHGNIAICIYNFLVNRKQFVIANGAK